MSALSSLVRLPHRVFMLYARVVNGMTLGVRGVVFDDGGRVLLVRHTYVPGWHFPGGGVAPGESAEVAVVRELGEEAGIAVEGRPELFGFYFNRGITRRDHVALFVCRRWHASERSWTARLEIAEARFFPLDALPETVDAGTRRRLAEIVDGVERSAEW
jgi:8-oxo-dGTP pyrophosphatase MutT (NUDIX family)